MKSLVVGSQIRILTPNMIGGGSRIMMVLHVWGKVLEMVGNEGQNSV